MPSPGTQFLEKTRAEALGAADWVGKTGFLSLVTEAVAAVSWPGKGELYAGLRSDRLMGLLVYCYAIGVYSSPDIARRCTDDAVAKELLGSHPPDWKALRSFRKSHREPLKRCISHVCEQALRIRFGHGASEPPLADYYVALALDRWFEPLCVPSPPDEAENRLGKAAFIDGMSGLE